MKRLIYILIGMAMLSSAGIVQQINAAEPSFKAFDTAKKKIGSQSFVTKEIKEGIFLFEGNDHKFALIDRDGNVLGYSSQTLNADGEMPPALINMIEKYAKFGTTATTPRSARYTPKLLNTPKFNQSAPFNNYLTENFDKRYVVGCVGTAMATVMKYYNWPPSGRGNVEFESYTWDWNDGGNNLITYVHNVDFSKIRFDWDNILTDYSEGCTKTQEKAVAELCYAAASSVKTSFDWTSSAYAEDVVEGMRASFYYNPEAYFYYAENMSSEEWEELLRAEIDAGRPVIYSGISAEDGFQYFDGYNGHAFVVDGYDETGLFHINWGWGGRYDGYFALTSLKPNAEQDFSYHAAATFGLEPDRDMTEIGRVSLYLSPYSPQHITGMSSDHEYVTANSRVNIANFAWKVTGEPFTTLSTAVGLCDKDGNIRAVSDIQVEINDFTLEYQLQGFSGNDNFYSEIAAREGDYLCMLYKGDGMTQWAKMDSYGPVKNRVSAYGYTVPHIPVTWKNTQDFEIENQFDTDIPVEQYINSMVAGHRWAVAIEPKKDFAHYQVLINGRTTHEDFYQTLYERDGKECLMLATYGNSRIGDSIEIEFVTLDHKDIYTSPVAITGVEPGTLEQRVREITNPVGVSTLKVEGRLTDTDFYFMRDYMYMLESLDIENVTIAQHDYNPEDYLPYKCFEYKFQLKEIALPKDLRGFHNNAFANTGLTKVYIPSSTTTWGLNVFNSCEHLEEVTIAQNVPPTISWCVFSGSNRLNATLRVPKGTKEAYTNNYEWGMFGNIVEDESLIDGIEDIELTPNSSAPLEYYNINGVKLAGRPDVQSIYIVKQGNIVTKEHIR